jgi:hypothetical protein
LLDRAALLAVDSDYPVSDCLYLILAQERGARLATADEPCAIARVTSASDPGGGNDSNLGERPS